MNSAMTPLCRVVVFGLWMAMPGVAWAQASTAGVVSSCGDVTYTAGQTRPMTVDVNGNLCNNGSGGGGGGGTQAAASTDGSSSITTGGTFQTVLAANTARKSVEIQNICGVSGNCNSTTDNCYVTTVAAASATKANSFLLAPGAYYGRINGVVPSDAIAMTCDTTGDKFKLVSQ